MKEKNKLDLDTFSEFWDIQVRNLWPEDYPEELSKKFKAIGVKTILDCAGGTGYPSIELKELGWDITYSDGSTTIRNFFLDKLIDKSLYIPSYLSKWEELSNTISKSFDAVLCSGNSFIGIAMYENDSKVISVEDTLIRMKKALGEFYKVINNNGFLYIDMPNEKSLKPSSPYVVSNIKNKDSTTKLEVTYDPKSNIRTTREICRSTKNNKLISLLEYSVHPISAEQIISLMLEVGFSHIEKSNLNIANYVDGYFAFKGTTKI